MVADSIFARVCVCVCACAFLWIFVFLFICFVLCGFVCVWFCLILLLQSLDVRLFLTRETKKGCGSGWARRGGG